MEDKAYLDQLKDIRNIMDRSTKFLSLSGLSGVLAGVYALLGAVTVHYIVLSKPGRYVTIESDRFLSIIAIAVVVLILSITTAFIFSKRKANKLGEKLWNSNARRLAINFSVPLITGGIVAITLLARGYFGFISPVMLLFYGLALFNASKFTFDTIRSLGIAFIILGLIALNIPGYSLLFWTIGFGFLHILYGSIMYFKYDRV